MSDFPRMLFRYPGATPLQDGKYDMVTVNDQASADTMLVDGWALTPSDARDLDRVNTEAAKAKKAEADRIQQIADAKALLASVEPTLPTRAELEQKANELGLKFDGRTSDKKLGDLIAATLES